ncbi:unnamed protein product [Symbiodinium natans]|uniref:Uncharacterized protein n=1 Tax=Symbiodinium natans TaxID=878477 RepID=A0A812NY63_9DINO|nr:unnamed protein product [Symbiodinium natans]
MSHTSQGSSSTGRQLANEASLAAQADDAIEAMRVTELESVRAHNEQLMQEATAAMQRLSLVRQMPDTTMGDWPFNVVERPLVHIQTERPPALYHGDIANWYWVMNAEFPTDAGNLDNWTSYADLRMLLAKEVDRVWNLVKRSTESTGFLECTVREVLSSCGLHCFFAGQPTDGSERIRLPPTVLNTLVDCTDVIIDAVQETVDLFPFIDWCSEYTKEEATLFKRLESENRQPSSVSETLVAKHCWICLRSEDAETLRTTGQFSLEGIYAGQFNLSMSARAALWRRGLWQTQTEESTDTAEQTWTLVAFRFTTVHFINLVTEGTLRFFNRRYSDYIVTTDPGLTEVPFTLNAQECGSIRRWTLVGWKPKDLFARSTADDWHRNCRHIVIGATVWTEATAIQLGEFITDDDVPTGSWRPGGTGTGGDKAQATALTTVVTGLRRAIGTEHQVSITVSPAE